MKRTVKTALTLVPALLLGTTAAFAAGKLDVSQENFHVIDSYSVYGYAFAKVENVGDKPIQVNAGLLEIFDKEGDTITSTDYMSAYAENLQPGDYTYVRLYEDMDINAEDIDDYLLTVTGKSDMSYTDRRFPVEVDYQADVPRSAYSTTDYIYATVTNDTDETVYDMEVVSVLLDDEGNILYLDGETMYNEGILPGSSVTVRTEISSDFKEYYASKGFQPTHADAIAYVSVPNEE